MTFIDYSFLFWDVNDHGHQIAKVKITDESPHHFINE